MLCLLTSSSKAFLKNVKDITIDADHLMIISPDEGATNRAIYLANVLGVDMGMFYKRRDYSRIVDGRNPIVAHEFLGSNVDGKDVLIIDDMISSGESMIDTAKELKKETQTESLSFQHSDYSLTDLIHLIKLMKKDLFIVLLQQTLFTSLQSFFQKKNITSAVI